MNKKEQLQVEVYKLIVGSMLIIAIVNFALNGVLLEGYRAFYLDDLGETTTILNRSLWQHLTDIGANKFRPITSLVMWLVVHLSQGNYEIIDSLLLALNFGNALIVYYFVYKIMYLKKQITRVFVATASAILFAVSRFAYYNITEFFGIMEGLGIAFSLGVLFCLVKYVDLHNTKWFYCASGLYLLSIYVHERYFVLIVLFIFAILFVEKGKIKKYYPICLPLLFFVSFWMLRFAILGNRVMDGTGGTDIMESFSVSQAISFAISQVGYLFGFNCGPAYLNGIAVEQVNIWVNLLLSVCAFCMAGTMVCYLYVVFKRKLYTSKSFFEAILIAIYIGSCIVSSSTTIRVEMRWIYSSYAAFIILFAFILNELDVQFHFSYSVLKGIFVFSFLVTVFCQFYYRSFYDSLYYWKAKEMSLALYEATIERYGIPVVENSRIIIISEEPYFEELGTNLYDFYNVYLTTSNMEIVYVSDFESVGNLIGVDKCNIVLYEDIFNKEYAQIDSEMFEVIKYEKGIYEDGWMEQEAHIRVKSTGNSVISLVFYYPEEIKGDEIGHIFVNGNWVQDYQIENYLTQVDVPLDPSVSNSVEIISDYYCVENSGRSEQGTLSCVLSEINLFN